MIDMRGNRILPSGHLKPGLPPILSERQKIAFADALASDGLKCILVCAEVPFVGPDPEGIKEQAKKLKFLKDHWPYELEQLIWLLDKLFSWKSAERGREVIMLGGDIHVSVDSVITDNLSGQTIRHITTSPITNSVSPFHPPLQGSLNYRYTYKHTPLLNRRTYCAIDLSLHGGAVAAAVELVGFPVKS